MNPYKKLGAQALVYGLGNIVPRVLNYAVLTVYYTRRFAPEEYGVITELYAYVAILLILLTYGMETGLFKFSSESSNKQLVYSTALTSVITTSVLFAFLIWILRHHAAHWIGYSKHPEYIAMLGITIAIDAVSSIIFAKLRLENKVRRFATLKVVNVLSTIGFVFLFLEIFPMDSWLQSSEWYAKNIRIFNVGFVFLANLLSSGLVLIWLLLDVKNVKLTFSRKLLFQLLGYSIPLLISGLAGIFNETIDRILLRQFTPEHLNPLYQIGIYGANYRIAVLMTIFVQMFRYAAEPFFFNQYKMNNANELYANVLKYFTIFLMIIFLGVGLCLDFFKLFIDKDYYEGLGIVPVVLMANVLVGLLFNINMWYKLSGHTMYGVYITGLGAVITIFLNILFIPAYGYFACAWTHIVTNLVMLALTYLYGQKVYKIPYDIKSVFLYIGIGLLLYALGILLQGKNHIVNITVGVMMVCAYFWFCNRKEGLINIFLLKHES